VATQVLQVLNAEWVPRARYHPLPKRMDWAGSVEQVGLLNVLAHLVEASPREPDGFNDWRQNRYVGVKCDSQISMGDQVVLTAFTLNIVKIACTGPR